MPESLLDVDRGFSSNPIYQTQREALLLAVIGKNPYALFMQNFPEFDGF